MRRLGHCARTTPHRNSNNAGSRCCGPGNGGKHPIRVVLGSGLLHFSPYCPFHSTHESCRCGLRMGGQSAQLTPQPTVTRHVGLATQAGGCVIGKGRWDSTLVEKLRPQSLYGAAFHLAGAIHTRIQSAPPSSSQSKSWSCLRPLCNRTFAAVVVMPR